jgi:hypothetical protein
VSEEEYAQLEKLAEERGLTLSEWLHELALAELTAHAAEQVILAEVLALRMLYLNTVQCEDCRIKNSDRIPVGPKLSSAWDAVGRPAESCSHSSWKLRVPIE